MKNKYSYIWISAIVLIFGIIFIPKIVDRVKTGTIVKKDRMSKLSFLMVNNKKAKVPAFSFVNQDSLVITNQDFLGKVYVVEFFFTTCPSICPVMNANLVDVQEEFKGFPDFGVASFTINPDYDTPIVLKAYAEKHGVTNLDWHFLTGDRDEIYDLANKGFYILAKEAPQVAGGFEHSGMFALVDKNGFIRSRRDAANNPIIYYRGTVTTKQGENIEGEKEQISILKEDIRTLLME